MAAAVGRQQLTVWGYCQTRKRTKCLRTAWCGNQSPDKEERCDWAHRLAEEAVVVHEDPYASSPWAFRKEPIHTLGWRPTPQTN